jgi:hypothetical protein
MAQQGKPDELVTLQELAVSNAYELAHLVAVLERKRILTQQELPMLSGPVCLLSQAKTFWCLTAITLSGIDSRAMSRIARNVPSL